MKILSKLQDILKDYPNLVYKKPPKHIDADVSIILHKEVKNSNKSLEDLKEEIIQRIYKCEFIKKVDYINGFINIKFNWEYIFNKYWPFILDIDQDVSTKIQIEHTSVNPNKAIHIGHFRNAVLGDAIYRLLSFKYKNIEVLNYIDDTGLQVADVILGIHILKIPEEPFSEEEVSKVIDQIYNSLSNLNIIPNKEHIKKIVTSRINSLKKMYGIGIPKKYDQYYGDIIYYIVNKIIQYYPVLENYRKKILQAIEKKETPIFEITCKIVDRVLKSQLRTLWNFNIYYDLLNYESDIIQFGLWADAFEILKEKKLIKYEEKGNKKGCWIIDLSKYPEFKNLEDPKKVIIRSDGTLVYLAKDIAYAFWKLGIIPNKFKYELYTVQPNNKKLWRTSNKGLKKDFGNADISINVIGTEQKYLQDIIKLIIKEVSNDSKKYIHYAYGLVLLSKETAKRFNLKIDENKKFVKMSGREGTYINVDNLLEESIKYIKEKILEKRPNISKEELEILSIKLAKSMLCYEMLKYSPSTEIIFDLQNAFKLEGNTAIYIQYTYARIKSLLTKGNIIIEDIKKDIEKYISKSPEYQFTNEELKLIKKIFEYPFILESSIKTLEIHKLSKYLFELCSIFNEFYQNVPILKEKDEKSYRIALILLLKIIIENLSYILKIELVDKL